MCRGKVVDSCLPVLLVLAVTDGVWDGVDVALRDLVPVLVMDAVGVLLLVVDPLGVAEGVVAGPWLLHNPPFLYLEVYR